MKNIQGLQNIAYVNAASSIIPEESETITISGGLGNMTLSQRKKEEGVYYKRNNEYCKWNEYNPTKEMLIFIQNNLV